MEKEYSTEKLLDLLSEYMEEIKGREVEITSVGWEKRRGEIIKFIVEYIDEYDDEEEKEYIGVGKLISNKFGFIEWLVENNKIYENKIPDKFEGYYYEIREYVFDKASILLMELAIKDDPIEFLVSILK